VYVKFVHLVDDRSGLFSWFVVVYFFMLKGVLYLLVCRICLMILFPFCFSSIVVINVSFLLYKYLIALILCSAGLHEVY
jgi:hypothetical protein